MSMTKEMIFEHIMSEFGAKRCLIIICSVVAGGAIGGIASLILTTNIERE